jgi:hypothetical protein
MKLSNGDKAGINGRRPLGKGQGSIASENGEENDRAYNLATLPEQRSAVGRQAMQEQEVLEIVGAPLAPQELQALQELPAAVLSACS